jgi:CRISPR-associated endonuclease/helicase Cas3
MDNYNNFFAAISGNAPHPWQDTLGSDGDCQNRLIRIPTGFGKTAGTVLPWLWHRVVQQNNNWPMRLVFCLPMRVLVEQTEANIRGWLQSAGLLWDGESDHGKKVGVHVLMGGCDAGDWHLHPEHPAILIGTQDMLLSRALNRGYASGRARWPVEFGLLNQDALWVVDEVQLMDVGLATSGQLQAFRNDDEQAGKSFRPCRTWWMSATMQPRWLESVDTKSLLATLPPMLEIPHQQRTGKLWEVSKLREIVVMDQGRDAVPKAIAGLVEQVHLPGKLTLVVVNRVDDANAVFDALLFADKQGIERKLVHSRFRPFERKNWREEFLTRTAPMPAAGRIVVATQVIEAGVDISADTLITDMAPWPSLVQRFGRCARYGGEGRVIVIDRKIPVEDDKSAAPYLAKELTSAREALDQVVNVSPAGLEIFEAELSLDQRQKLYPYVAKHLLLRRELDELFDTTTDLTGADLDISRFIRSGDERDCQIWWHEIVADQSPSDALQPSREALCTVPSYRVEKWLFGSDKKLNDSARAWTWDYLSGVWRELSINDCRPGRVILVDSTFGGYNSLRGFTGDAYKSKSPPILIVPSIQPKREDLADMSQDREDLSTPVNGGWQTIATHGGCVGNYAETIARELELPEIINRLLGLSGRLHDWGKVHKAFRACLDTPDAHPFHDRSDLAKAPAKAWLPPKRLYDLSRVSGDGQRKGFRHELASTLALFELLARKNDLHPALLGNYQELIKSGVIKKEPITELTDGALSDELQKLTAEQFDLVAYLICSHHGKIRVSWHAAPDDQDFSHAETLGMPLRGVCAGDQLPPLPLIMATGETEIIPSLTLHLDLAHMGLSGRYGRSWRERTAALQKQFGPFALAFLETCLRAADVRASRTVTPDPLLGQL